MTRWTVCLALVLLVALFTAAPLQSASREYPNSNLCAGAPTENVPAGAGGAMRLIAKYKPVGGSAVSLDTGIPANIALVGCETGEETTAKSARRICNACDAVGDPVISGTMLPFDCNTLANSSSDSFDCAVDGVARVKVDNSPLDVPPALDVNPKTVATELIGLTSTTNAGNAVSVDLLPNLLVQVTPGSTPGQVTVTVEFLLGGAPATGFITTQGKTQDTIHTDLRNLFQGFGYASATSQMGMMSAQFAQTDGMFNDSAFVFVPNVGTLNGNAVKSVTIKGGPGDLIEVENSVSPSIGSVPTMSEWGIAVLVTLLLLSGIYLMRRQSAVRPS